MQKNDIVRKGQQYFRVLSIKDNKVLVINCLKKTMPVWMDCFTEDEILTIEDLLKLDGRTLPDIEKVAPAKRKTAFHRFGLISPVVASIDNKKKYSELLKTISEEQKVSIQTLRNHLCDYLVFQNISVLIPADKISKDRELKDWEKNCRWALNRWYYNQSQHSLQWTYNQMLREKYCDAAGKLLEDRPLQLQMKKVLKKSILHT